MLSGRREHSGRRRLEHEQHGSRSRQCCRLQQAVSAATARARLQHSLAPRSGRYTAVAGSRAPDLCVVHAMWLSGCARDRSKIGSRPQECVIFEGNRPFWASIGHTISRALRARARSAARPRASRAGGVFTVSHDFAAPYGIRSLRRAVHGKTPARAENRARTPFPPRGISKQSQFSHMWVTRAGPQRTRAGPSELHRDLA